MLKEGMTMTATNALSAGEGRTNPQTLIEAMRDGATFARNRVIT